MDYYDPMFGQDGLQRAIYRHGRCMNCENNCREWGEVLCEDCKLHNVNARICDVCMTKHEIEDIRLVHEDGENWRMCPECFKNNELLKKTCEVCGNVEERSCDLFVEYFNGEARRLCFACSEEVDSNIELE